MPTGVYERKPKREERDMKIIEQWRIGWSQTEIARQLGTTRCTVAGVLSRAREAGLVGYRNAGW